MADHTAKRIEMIELLQKLKRDDEAPGMTKLRAMRTAVRLADMDRAVLIGLNAIAAKYPRELAFANTGFTMGVVRTIIDALLTEVESPT
jgi:hypothetical protein